mgnify:CR=1 FL=1
MFLSTTSASFETKQRSFNSKAVHSCAIDMRGRGGRFN